MHYRSFVAASAGDRSAPAAGPMRCPAAHAEDPRPCDAPEDAVRIVDRTGASVAACVLHGAVLLASLEGGRVYPLNGPDGSAIAVYSWARIVSPFDFMTAPRLAAQASAKPDRPVAPRGRPATGPASRSSRRARRTR